MKRLAQLCILVCLVFAVAAAGCLSNDGNESANTSNYTNITNDSVNANVSAANNSSGANASEYKNSTAYLIKQVRISDDKKTITFVFDETDEDKWALIMEPQGVLILQEDLYIPPEKPEETDSGIHVWVFESGKAEKTILDFNYVVQKEDKSINHIIYIIEVNNAGEISIKSLLHERL
ncbi:hypothetical protein MmiEs2_07130 [Methanimicrococcus stummii]|uniref:Lipoprotein n=1 Tax=Methanimicrococcus stummii TaxID=3028294 RepID=A0AA96ZYU7_9EURY|nr:protease inhibitor I42 family protein [Methanimicrococcus sp. Es2]WNY28522.1 hypothetical protein MmiEs2_07130 [Methanimicrococcus sp. Es2]